MNVCITLLLGIVATTSISLHALESAQQPLHIPTALGINDKKYGMIFSGDGEHIIVSYFTGVKEEIDISHYTYDNNKLTKQPDQLSFKEDCSRILNSLMASSDYPKIFFIQNYVIRAYQPNTIMLASAPDPTDIAQVTTEFNFTHKALFACSEAKGYPLIAHIDPSDATKCITIINGKTGYAVSVEPQIDTNAQIHDMAFTRMSNSSACTLALLLTEPKSTGIACVKFSLSDNGKIIGQTIVPTHGIIFKHLDGTVSESDPTYATSCGWTIQGDTFAIVRRMPLEAYVVHPETSVCTPTPSSFHAYHIVTEPEQKKKDDLRTCAQILVNKEMLNNVRQSAVQVSPNGLHIIVDGILVNLKK